MAQQQTTSPATKGGQGSKTVHQCPAGLQKGPLPKSNNQQNDAADQYKVVSRPGGPLEHLHRS